ncbi:uncharacterized protein [Rutidosis leptorrhynchoides]|uniref:uncharacterized protein n=1 Tax=Rutidosis leptorrhynchoides TaxID=125765 RepID=UPI003A99DF37
MARTSSSSKRKYSKKKSLKLSSEANRKKKSRRNESKKLRRHDDSFSSSSDDESSTSSVFSSSSSDGEYKSKRSRSRVRSEVKGSKKRSKRRSLSEDSSGEDSPPSKKRKRSKKKGDKKMKKKTIKKKKKSKRDAYISSASSDSESCSTCKDDDDSSSDEGAPRMRSRGRSRGKKKDHKKRSYKDRSRTRSSSPSNSYDDDVSVEKVMVENNSRRLKSVITVVKPSEDDEVDMKTDELKEEIVYDNDDYPSCKSNDSNELVDRSNVSPEKNIPTSVISEVNSTSVLNDSKEKKSDATGSEVDKLELILRQKALENLSKFRGGNKAKTAVSVDDTHSRDQSSVKQLTSARVDRGQSQSLTPVSQPVVPRSRFTWRRDPSVVTAKVETAVSHSGPHTSELQPVAPKIPSARVENKTVIEKKGSTESGTRPKLQRTRLSPASRVEKETVSETSESIVNKDNTSGSTETKVDQKSNTAPETSASASSVKEGNSKVQQTETTDSSQFEKKTMSVMRGGEMVQVSYKVYIPTRAPALARRQLKR